MLGSPIDSCLIPLDLHRLQGKFTVFDLSTKWMYEQFPAAREDIQLSLLVSLAGGTLGGLVAAVVSNPGDATVSEMKKAKTDMGPIAAAKKIIERGGPQALFTGLPLRMLFYPVSNNVERQLVPRPLLTLL